ncbi:hypothetical protein BRD00_10395 [Halobacteriales archaeon QS_8_69_26]|nr:MAG: hypothetical protein BRD00_10395 [Halobacteriales archaeon QS_8_69_26]
MAFSDWYADAKEHVREDGWSGAKEAAYEFYIGMFRQSGRVWNYGTPIYEHDWDVFVVLDACRADLMAEVADEYDFVDTTTTYSVGSSSGEWIQKNFVWGGDDEEVARTDYVTANPYSDRHLDAGDFGLLDEVWRYAFDEEVRTIPADSVTDRAITVHRERDPEYMVVHYMQPHHPFVENPLDEGLPLRQFGNTPWDDVWDKLRKGRVDRDEVWTGYRNNLRYVLDSVETLLESIDAERVLISADHANLLGEFGLYAHPSYVPIPALKRVPLCETTASDTGEYEPADVKERAEESASVEEKLQHLGYKT